jgi:hypothetical protein
MEYSKVQCIGYEIYTGPGGPRQYYVGLNSDADDIDRRVSLMGEAIQTASRSASIDASASTLKLFMAPEFYFRGMRGAYTPDPVVGNAVPGDGLDPASLLAKLTTLVKGADFANWLFVFGTVVMRSSPNPLSLWDRFVNWITSKPDYEVYNVAIVQKGGFTSEAERLSSCVVAMKELKSDIDFLKLPPVGVDHKSSAHLPSGPVSYQAEVNTPVGLHGAGFNGGSLFTLDGITFGVEVCLDHAARRVRRARPGHSCFVPQIQLVPSGGMSIEATSVATVRNGLVFNVDGLTTRLPETPRSSAAYGYHSDLRTTSCLWPQNLADLSGPTAPTSRVPAHARTADLNGVFWLPSDTAVPQIAVYPSTAIPNPAIIT